MSDARSIVKIYAEAEDFKRIDIIFEHFDNFIRLIEMFEEGLRDTLKEEKLYNKRTERGEIGIRVQTSGCSDPTGNSAAGNIDLLNDMRIGSIDSALKGVDEDLDHRIEIETLRIMRSDYFAIIKAIEHLRPRQRAELTDSLNGTRDISTIADDSNSGYEATKHRLNRNRRKVRKLAIVYMREDRRKGA